MTRCYKHYPPLEVTNRTQRDPRLASALDAVPLSWSIGIYIGESPLSLRPSRETNNPVLSRSDVWDVPVSFVADPFMIRADNEWHMFFEAKNLITNKGEIGHAVSSDALNWKYRRMVLDEPFHLSYPYVFEHRGEHYLLPESLDANQVRLYRADPFPNRWRHVANLIEGQFADPSIAFLDGRWWLFACSRPFDHDVLRLFWSDSLFGPWQEHPRSPIVDGDPHIARPAGRVVSFNGRLIRYAQDCYPSYGIRVHAFEISELTPTTYVETVSKAGPIVEPGPKPWNGKGMHHVDPHLNADGSWIACVDGRHLA